MEIRAFFAGRPQALALYRRVAACVDALGPTTRRVTKSQIGWHRRRGFAWVWTPDRYLHGDVAPLVLSLALPRGDDSPRWKEVVEPRPGHFMHHLELRSDDEVDDEVQAWLREAFEDAG